jgi:hypothetical protein
LTYSTDRLPALAGIAEKAQGSRTDRYCAGLWEDSLLDDLCWCAAGRAIGQTGRPQTSAPSWSWASAGCAMLYNYANYDSVNIDTLCDILSVKCTPQNPSNPKGNVSSGEIRLRGHITKATYRYEVDTGEHTVSTNSIFNSITIIPDYNLAASGNDQVNDGEELFVLTLIRPKHSLKHSLTALVLRCVDQVLHIYQRVGFLDGTVRDSNLVLLFPKWELVPGGGGGSPRDFYWLDFITYWNERIQHDLGIVDFIELDSYQILAKLTPEQALMAERHSHCENIRKREGDFLSGDKEGEWFLNPENAEKKSRGESYRRWYLGKIVTIV